MRPSFCKVREEGLFYCIAPSAQSPPPMPLGANNMLTECAEGSVVTGVGGGLTAGCIFAFVCSDLLSSSLTDLIFFLSSLHVDCR